MIFGYVRVSTEEQNLRMQEQALSDAGCEEILADKGVRGNAVVKPQLARLLDKAREGDTCNGLRLSDVRIANIPIFRSNYLHLSEGRNSH